jgi:uncharacterized protein (DUF1330 family)
MPAYVIGQIRVVDQDQWAAYRNQVPATLAPWGGRIVFRGRTARVLSGAYRFGDVVVLEFPDQDAVRGWHDSPAYQALIPLRDRAAEVVLVSYGD